MYDVAVIGAGVIGCAIARHLSQFKTETLLLEKESDVSMGASKANSGIVHGGYAAPHGTLKGRFNLRGNALFPELERRLHFGFRRTGALVLGFNSQDRTVLEKLKRNGEKAGLTDLEIIGRDEILRREPALNPQVWSALSAPSVGVTSPYEFTIALAENAVKNGTDLRLESPVVNLLREKGGFRIETPADTYRARYVINAAGIYSDRIAALAGAPDFQIRPRKGQYILFDRGTGSVLQNVIFQVPTERGKGVLVCSTYHRNLMIGPDAVDTQDRENRETDAEALAFIEREARRSYDGFDLNKAIRSFSGLRAVSSTGDFVIGTTRVPGFINAAGIDSPGLTSAPAIAEEIAAILRSSGLTLEPDPAFDPERPPIIPPDKSFVTGEELARGLEGPSRPDRIICRCEQVREKSIVDAMERGIPVSGSDGIKRRTRAGMGRCQGRFCGPRVKEVMSRISGRPVDEIEGPSRGSGILPRK